MLNLQFAPSADLLIPLLLARLRSVWKDPFGPPTVIVPSPAVGKWLCMRLAADADKSGRKFGCIANLALPTLERYLWKALKPDVGMRLLDVGHFHQIICSLLDWPLISDSSYKPVRDYLCDKGSDRIDPIKRVQLAARIAHQFLEYEYNRPSVWDEERGKWKPKSGIDAHWLRGENYGDEKFEHQAWQKDLYRKADACIAGAGEEGERWISLPRLYRLRREAEGWAEVSGTVFLFGVTKVSHFHRNMLVEISQMTGVDVRVFLTNPCAEFWEDVDTRRSGKKVRRSWKHDSPEDIAGITPRQPDDYGKSELSEFWKSPGDHKLLELWGSAGKENIFLWCQQAEWNFDYFGGGPDDGGAGSETLLRSLQNSLLCRDPARPDKGGKPDGTLDVLACPDRGREIEEIRERILDLVHERKLEKLNDAVVFLADPGEYVPHIQRVFGAFQPGDAEYIPFCLLGAPGNNSVFSQGVRALLELMQGRFDRARVFELLRNPMVQATRDISASQVAVWEEWAEKLGIFRGFNRGHRAEMGDIGQAITEAHTFESAMYRMLLGNLSAGPIDLDFRAQEQAAGDHKDDALPIMPYRDFETSDRDVLETFCSTVEQLYNDTKSFKKADTIEIDRALDDCEAMVREWSGKIPDSAVLDASAEGNVQRAFFDALKAIRLQKSAGKRGRMSLDELIALVGGCLPDELPTHASAWTGGITFAPLRPSMIVPHRIVFAAGLDAAAFPGSSDRPTWDLLAHRRIVGDSDRVRDNRFAFLELIHAARERLLLSFRAWNMQKEEELQPSSVILELESFLKGQGCSKTDTEGKAYCPIRREIPWIVHESLDQMVESGRLHGAWDRAEIELARLSACERKSHRHELRGATDACAATTGADTGTAALHTTLYDLQRFFSNPLEYHLYRTLGIDLDEESATMSATDEPLDSGALALSKVQKSIWTKVLRAIFPAEVKDAVIDEAGLTEIAVQEAGRAYDEHVWAGGAPEAQIGTLERSSVVHWAAECAGPALALVNEFKNHTLLENADLSLGRSREQSRLAIYVPDTGECTIEGRHGLALVPRNDSGNDAVMGIVGIKKEGKAEENPDLWLAGVVQWLVEQERKPGYSVKLAQLNRENDRKIRVTVALFNSSLEIKDRIEAWLRDRLVEMLAKRCSDHLPFAVVQSLVKQTKEPVPWDLLWARVSAENIGDKLADEDHPVYRCYLPAFNLTDARIPDVKDDGLRERARSRFAPMLEGWLSE
jgi:exonuclease V gamma subunit